MTGLESGCGTMAESLSRILFAYFGLASHLDAFYLYFCIPYTCILIQEEFIVI